MKQFEIIENKATPEQIHSFLLQTEHMFDPPLHNNVDLETYANKLHASARRLEIWDDNRLIALNAIYFNEKDFSNDFKEKDVYLAFVAILQDYQGLGIGKALRNDTINIAKKGGYKNIYVDVDITNKFWIDSFLRLGFVIVKQIKNSHLLKLSLSC